MPAPTPRARRSNPQPFARSTYRAVKPRKAVRPTPVEAIPARLSVPPINELMAAVIAETLETLQDWSTKWSNWRDRTRVNNFAHHLKAAIEAHEWLTDETTSHSQRLTCREACELLDIDQAWLVEKTYALLNPEALQVLLSPPLAWKALQDCAAANQRRAVAVNLPAQD